MTNTDAFVTVAFLFLLVLFVRGPWRSMCLDFARQVMFEHRDAVFDMALAGKLEFDSQEYRHIRMTIERNIRFAHEASFARLFFFRKYLNRTDPAADALHAALTSIPDTSVRDEASGHIYRTQRAMLVMLVARSPLLILLGLLVSVASTISKRASAQRRAVTRDLTQALQNEADQEPFTWRQAA